MTTLPSDSPVINLTDGTEPAPIRLRCLSVIIPVYNEVKTLPEIVRRVVSVPVPKEIVIIDDCSTDGSRDLLKAIEREAPMVNPRHGCRVTVKALFHDRNQGKGAAIRTGIGAVSGDLVVIQDADLEYNPAEYPRLIEPILSGDADVVYGSRFTGDRRRVLFFWHQLGNEFLTFLSNMFTNLNLSDMETGYKVFKTDVLKSFSIRSNRFGIEPEITAKVARLGLRIYEVPISYRGRGYGEGKKITWRDGIVAILTILKFAVFRDVPERPAGPHADPMT